MRTAASDAIRRIALALCDLRSCGISGRVLRAFARNRLQLIIDRTGCTIETAIIERLEQIQDEALEVRSVQIVMTLEVAGELIEVRDRIPGSVVNGKAGE